MAKCRITLETFDELSCLSCSGKTNFANNNKIALYCKWYTISLEILFPTSRVAASSYYKGNTWLNPKFMIHKTCFSCITTSFKIVVRIQLFDKFFGTLHSLWKFARFAPNKKGLLQLKVVVSVYQVMGSKMKNSLGSPYKGGLQYEPHCVSRKWIPIWKVPPKNEIVVEK